MWRRVIRFSLENEIREGIYWEEENRICRVCGGEVETWEHVWKGCKKGSIERESWQEAVGEVLGEGGEGEWWIREVEEERKGIIDEGEEKVEGEEEIMEKEEEDKGERERVGGRERERENERERERI